MRYAHVGMNLVVTLLIVMAFFTLGPIIESSFFPVYSKFKIRDIAPYNEGTLVQFEFTKYRNCQPQGFAFFNGELNQAFYQIVTKVHAGPEARERPLGTQLSSPFEFVGITPEQVRTTVFAEIYSTCHPLWPVKTRVYP